MSLTISGQITNGAGSGQLVTAVHAAWPIANPAGASATDPGTIQALCAADGSWSLDASTLAGQDARITTPQGTSAGTLPDSGTTSLASLQSGSAWSQNGAT
jgi:hypothetical protein